MGKTFQFIVFPFLFQINRSKDKGVTRLFGKFINKKSVIKCNILKLCIEELGEYNSHKDAAN
jgi:hypothetical protein